MKNKEYYYVLKFLEESKKENLTNVYIGVSEEVRNLLFKSNYEVSDFKVCKEQKDYCVYIKL